MTKPRHKTLLVLLLIYFAASLIHFIHNAEFLAHYPNLPTEWTREGIYITWAEITAVGIVGWVLLYFGYTPAGHLALAAYAACGLISLGHYVLAPFSHHTLAMHATILFEVFTATLVLTEIIRQIINTGRQPEIQT